MNWYIIYILDIDECVWPCDQDLEKTLFDIGSTYFRKPKETHLFTMDIFPTFAYFLVECTEEYAEEFRTELNKKYNADCVIKLFRKMED